MLAVEVVTVVIATGAADAVAAAGAAAACWLLLRSGVGAVQATGEDGIFMVP